ncbi:2-oxo acid dehydrogenase subunit E2 [Thermaerobacter sp. FW80]|uniref:dihydrolipoamide acetyltransferase family protein n=1 Tax=Thermaerobacter sp. FW80 TaxID=2546351 RepID=UPI0010755814|nr:dihydrolipoamide acetyltransferase family protein [Thermaerobacter sp. FW80]QBS36614.1 2-oxo acid dehydrogenase subunit E2 [Thermaerobacter sp. FW80]
MMEPVIMPVLDMTMERGIILRWLKKEGDPVRAGEPLFEVETDKADIEVEAPADGVLARIVHPEGAEVPVREIVAYIAAPGERYDDDRQNPPQPKADVDPSARSDPAQGAAQGEVQGEARKGAPEVPSGAALGRNRIRATPAARRRARELGLDLARVPAGGRGGVIRLADVEAAAATMAATTKGEPGPRGRQEGGRVDGVSPTPRDAEHGAFRPPAPEPEDDGVERIPVTGNRKAVAERMVQSARIPQVTLFARADAEAIQDFRRRLEPAVAEATGQSLSYTALFAFAVARTLPRFPDLNAHWRDGEIWRFRSVHLGIAVALPAGGLVVPVVRHADRRPLAELVKAVADVTSRAREGRLKPDEIGGGTFTLSNLGMFGVEAFNALLNPPQVGILSVGTFVKEPVGGREESSARTWLTLGLTFDHRALDGADAARYLRFLVETLSDPWRLLVS